MRLGLLSTARINDEIVSGAAESDLVDVVAVGSRDGARAQAYAGERGIPKAHASYEELLADDELEFLEETLAGMGAAEWAGMGEDELQQRFVGWQEARGAPS